ncbi:MAG: 50S ribosomal protein L11 methyltransferase [Nitrospiraceae bacterium]|nr:50S ribosomal protein L11 methyltransferase [Nitrospiraceae bacterium]
MIQKVISTEEKILTYHEITIKVAEESKDALLARLSEMGCLGTMDAGDTDGGIVAYFGEGADIAHLTEQLDGFRDVLAASGLDAALTFEAVSLPDRDWNEVWKKNIVPLDIGGVFAIVPSWEKELPDRINLVLDPGMVFGTGHHHSTQSSLLLIRRFMQEGSKDRFLDIGTGTGVLAIAASKLGFREVVGVDIDPLAVDAAPRNIALNRLDNVVIREGDITASEGTFDFIAGNLLSEIIISIAPEIAAKLKDRGTVVLSGIMTGQEDGVRDALERTGLKCIEKVVADVWVSLVCRRLDSFRA